MAKQEFTDVSAHREQLRHNISDNLEKGHGPLDKSKLVLKEITDKAGKKTKRWVHVDTGEELPLKHAHGTVVHYKVNDKKTGEEHHKGEVVGHFHMSMHPAVVLQVKSHKTGKVHNIVQEKASLEPLPGSDVGSGEKRLPFSPPAGVSAEDLEDLGDVNTKFETFARFTRTVAKGRMKSLIAYGTGGVGKTYTVTEQLDSMGKIEFDEDIHAVANSAPSLGDEDEPEEDEDGMVKSKNYDYVKITGKSSPVALYQALYEHNGKTILFDDCDSVLKEDNAINILKGALDTSGKGTISWGTAGTIKDSAGNPLPKRFKFTGRVIFISNLPSDKVPQPIKSRALRIDLTMTAEQTIERIGHILDHIKFDGMDVTPEDKKEVLEMLDKYKHHLTDLNVRTLGSLIAIKHEADEAGVDWKKDAKHMIFAKSNESNESDANSLEKAGAEETAEAGDDGQESMEKCLSGDDEISFEKAVEFLGMDLEETDLLKAL